MACISPYIDAAITLDSYYFIKINIYVLDLNEPLKILRYNFNVQNICALLNKEMCRKKFDFSIVLIAYMCSLEQLQ